jgi:hypothetical protein|tara:strand:- start:2824 stop:3114 length:291 start_codon:yes stop_codon:yes gene_type:complete
MKLEIKDNCPLNNFEPCKKLDCAWFIQMTGTNPQTGEQVDEWGCSVALLPMLMIENARESSQTGAAIESFRNVMVEQQKELLGLAKTGEVETKLIK